MSTKIDRISISISPPERFSFKHTVGSHGWSDLPPFSTGESLSELEYTFLDKSGLKAVPAKISIVNGEITVSISENIDDKIFLEKIKRDTAHILRLDEDLSEFYEIVDVEGNLKWISEKYAGRLLRSPTVFEDLIKTICTTNCSWSLTKSMVSNLVRELGVSSNDGAKAFPTASAMASQPESFYRESIRAGYRAPYLVEIAEAVASKKIDPESWLSPDLSTAELKNELKSVKGIGNYAAENMLKLLGRYDGLALDSWLRAQFYKKHNFEETCDDKTIRDFYENFGSWRGLAIWCDMTQRWFEEN
ncbi:MAG: DNA-3-methyladenine glycosylase 2 family protein [Pyrinomonadaceae bacterium]|nr:DNA-3-methyladenine glycosylase 2 family protein [Pyrinomonadaceae bacterium]